MSTRRFGSRKRAIFELIVFSEGIHNLPRIFQFVSSSRLSVPINVLKWSQYVEQVQQRGRSASLSFMYAIRLLLVRPFWSLTVNQRNPGIKVNGLWRVHVKKKQEEKKSPPIGHKSRRIEGPLCTWHNQNQVLGPWRRLLVLKFWSGVAHSGSPDNR